MFNYGNYSTILSNSFFREKSIKIILILSILINLFTWIFLVWSVKGQPESIPLHYNIYFGIDLYGNWYEILVLPSFGLLFLVINSILGAIFFSKEKILSYFLAGFALLGVSILSLASILIIYIGK